MYGDYFLLPKTPIVVLGLILPIPPVKLTTIRGLTETQSQLWIFPAHKPPSGVTRASKKG